jgi:hypothetical protein
MKKIVAFLIVILSCMDIAAQNVGIGTTTPIDKLEVRGSTTDDGVVLSVGNADGSHKLGLFGGRLNDPNPFIKWKDGDPLRFATDLSGFNELMRIMSNGNVGIGTSNPTLAKLHVQGMVGNTVAMFSDIATLQGISLVADYPGVFFNSYWNNGLRSMSASGYSSFIGTDQTNGDFTFNMSDVANTTANGLITVPERMRITGSGNVGIGTATPGFPLNFATILGDKISLYGNSGDHYGFGIQNNILQVHSDAAAANIAFGYGSSSAFNERMRIVNSGVDGVILSGRILLKNGTGSITDGPGVWMYKTDNSALLGFMGAENNQNIGFFGGPLGWGFTYDAINSQVGIGNNNPNAPLAFGPSLGKKITLYPGATGDVGFAVQGNVLQVFADHPNADVAFGYDQSNVFTERMRVKGSGNVGIATSNPTEKLEVNGNIKAQSYKLSTPKTSYYSVPPSAFQAMSSNDVISVSSFGISFNAVPTPSGGIVAPVNLPQGAIVTSFTLYFYDNAVGTDIKGELRLHYHGTSSGAIMASVSSAGVPLGGNAVDNTINNSFIDHQNFDYSIEVSSTVGAWPGSSLMLYSAVITYTVSEVN